MVHLLAASTWTTPRPLDAYLKAPGGARGRAPLLPRVCASGRVPGGSRLKGYATHVPSPDFVVMFLPGEMFFSAAHEQDPSPIEFGIGLDTRVILPASALIARRAVAYGCAEEMEENANQRADGPVPWSASGNHLTAGTR